MSVFTKPLPKYNFVLENKNGLMSKVTKRDGSVENLDIEKIHRIAEFACKDLSGVSVSELELNSQIQFYDGIKTSDITEILIKSAADLITEDSPNYQYVAGRLINYNLRKMAYGRHEPPHLWDHVNMMVVKNLYDKDFLTKYTMKEFEILNQHMKHERDNEFTYAAMEQWRQKYLIKNRVTNHIYETPQFAYMLIGMYLFINEKNGERIQLVKDFYDALSQFYISLATPILAGVRTPDHQFSSCTLIDTGDSLNSINATASAIVHYLAHRAGMGVNVGRIRAINSPVRGGVVYHTGIIPFLKYLRSAVKCCSQGGVRVASSTFNYPIWHYEVEDLLVLKNNKGTEDNRIRDIDYCVHLNRVMYERLLSGGNITLFSPHDVEDLYEAFYTNTDKFKELYEKYEADPTIRKKTVKALDLFSTLIMERKDTGRIYIFNADHVNDHGAFIAEKAPTYMTNLCVEVTLPTQPMAQDNSEISLCVLSALNWGKFTHYEQLKPYCKLIVRALDNLIDLQSYLDPAAEYSTRKRRPLGIGITNLAYWLVKRDSSYSNPDLNELSKWMAAQSHYLIDASADLAIERGPCEKWEDTKYSKGILPIDTAKEEVFNLFDADASMIYKLFGWTHLAEKVKKTGIRNSTLMAQMPVETSSLITNSTNGIEPPRALVAVKQSKDGSLKQVVPEIRKYKNKYELLWDIKETAGYLNICAVMQAFMDQSVSCNFSYNPAHYPDNKLPLSVLMKDFVNAYKLGIKTYYYLNTNDGAGEVEDKKPIEQQNNEITNEEDCESCKL